MLGVGIADIVDVVDISIGIADIVMDIADIITDIADIVNIVDIADWVLRTLQWEQVGAYKVSQGCPVIVRNTL